MAFVRGNYVATYARDYLIQRGISLGRRSNQLHARILPFTSHGFVWLQVWLLFCERMIRLEGKSETHCKIVVSCRSG